MRGAKVIRGDSRAPALTLDSIRRYNPPRNAGIPDRRWCQRARAFCDSSHVPRWCITTLLINPSKKITTRQWWSSPPTHSHHFFQSAGTVTEHAAPPPQAAALGREAARRAVTSARVTPVPEITTCGHGTDRPNHHQHQQKNSEQQAHRRSRFDQSRWRWPQAPSPDWSHPPPAASAPAQHSWSG